MLLVLRCQPHLRHNLFQYLATPFRHTKFQTDISKQNYSRPIQVQSTLEFRMPESRQKLFDRRRTLVESLLASKRYQSKVQIVPESQFSLPSFRSPGTIHQ
jgi:hypothetical protein